MKKKEIKRKEFYIRNNEKKDLIPYMKKLLILIVLMIKLVVNIIFKVNLSKIK